MPPKPPQHSARHFHFASDTAIDLLTVTGAEANNLIEAGLLTHESAIRIERVVDQSWQDFKRVHEEYGRLENLPDDLTEDILRERVREVGTQYCQLKATLAVPAPPPQVVMPAVEQQHNHHAPNVCLPQLNLPKFSGQPADWETFYSSFKALIEANLNLTDSQRLQYLRSALSNDSIRLISHLPLDDNSYAVAIQLLKERFGNVRHQIFLHCKELLDLPTISDFKVDNLRQFLDSYAVHTKALELLPNANSFQNFFVTFLLQKLSPELRLKFENTNFQGAYPTPNDLINWLTTRVVNLENAALSVQTNQHVRPHKNRGNVSLIAATSHRDRPAVCPVCNDSHRLGFECKTFRDLNVDDRWNFVKNKTLCFNCLQSHPIERQASPALRCPSRNSCQTCGRRHHTLLHPKSRQFSNYKPNAPMNSNVAIGSNNKQTDNLCKQTQSVVATNSCDDSSLQNVNSTLLAENNNTTDSTVLLGTVMLCLRTTSSKTILVRAILDTASHANIITRRAFNKLGVSSNPSDIQLSGLSESKVDCNSECKLDLQTRSGLTLFQDSPFQIVNNITTPLPRVAVSRKVRDALSNYKLADDLFDVTASVDALLGCQLTLQLFSGKPVSLGKYLPFAVETPLGYVLFGNAPVENREPVLFISESPDVDFKTGSSVASVLTCTSENESLNKTLELFWKIEEPPPSNSRLSDKEIQCEEFYSSTTVRYESGRYQVRLPFTDLAAPMLGDSYKQAYSRLLLLERKFKTQPEFRQKYIEFMNDYESAGHMHVLSSNEHVRYFIPHHGIFKAHGDTSKIRVVFDASCKTSNGISLNERLFAGPKLQSYIPDIIATFRTYPFVFTCDIQQMFRQILVHPDDQYYQCILWRSDPTQPVKTYALNTVTYGTTCAPYLAIRTVKQLASDEVANFPRASHILANNTFVDDIIAGASSIEEGQALIAELTALLLAGGLQLRKWSANNSDLLTAIPLDYREKLSAMYDKHVMGVLGLQWDPCCDSFVLHLPAQIKALKCTKRTVLSTVAQLYDPCGWLAPCVLRAKHFLQLLWLDNVGWDDVLPSHLQSAFKELSELYSNAEPFILSRPFLFSSDYPLELHGFCDASEIGYGAVLYLTQRMDTSCHSSLLAAKSRVAPVKSVSIPRLELLGAHLLSSLADHFATVLKAKFPDLSIFLWTDSSIVLSWLTMHPCKLKTFVANRITQILDLTPPTLWKHVPTNLNPADLVSRGTTPQDLRPSSLWWSGPEFIRSDPRSWPAFQPKPQPKELVVVNSECRPDKLLSSNLFVPSLLTAIQTKMFDHISTWPRVVKVIEIIFKSWLPISKSREHLHRRAEYAVCHFIQQCEFHDLYLALKANHPCAKRFAPLSPFLDPTSDLIRVGGRLSNSSLPFSTRHPILLPKSHRLVALLIDFYHYTLLHAGTSYVLNALSQRFWIISGKQAVKARIFRCIKCFRVNPRNSAPVMGHLPVERVTPSPPFFHSGVDFCGPFSVKCYRKPRSPVVKVYLCLFVCFATKAVHLELARDLSTEAFLDVFHRFISRRGRPDSLRSDCGTNFVGAQRYLSRALRQFVSSNKFNTEFKEHLTSQGTKFVFNPPHAPHFGGLWERAIRSAKVLLHRVLGSHILTYESFYTLLARVEAILNSRPLTPLSNDPNDLKALTPAHFLVGRPLTAHPELNTIPPDMPTLKMYKLLTKLTNEFWGRWRKEFLATLQRRPKWTRAGSHLSVGDLVLLSEPNLPPLAWPLGRITALHPGKDGIARVAEVQTTTGNYLRPVINVFKLPLEQ